MPTSPVAGICHWGLGIACMIGLAACGAAERPADAPGQSAPQPTTIAVELPTATSAVVATAELPTLAPDTPTAIAITQIAQAPAALPKETAMPDQKPSQPPARPTLQVAATLVPEGAAPATPPSAARPALAQSPQVDVAKADLARRRGVAPDTIQVIEVRSVTWPNPGLGCPQPGMAYKQVPVDGLLIRLESGGQIFEYHSGGSKAPFLCENPAGGDKATPVSGGEGT